MWPTNVGPRSDRPGEGQMKTLVMVVGLLLGGRLAAAQIDSVPGSPMAQLMRDFKNPGVAEECVWAHPDSAQHVIEVDSMMRVFEPQDCQGFQGAIIFLRERDTIPVPNIQYLNKLVLLRRPDFLVVCGIQFLPPIVCASRYGSQD
jgi:hypothetical protein